MQGISVRGKDLRASTVSPAGWVVTAAGATGGSLSRAMHVCRCFVAMCMIKLPCLPKKRRRKMIEMQQRGAVAAVNKGTFGGQPVRPAARCWFGPTRFAKDPSAEGRWD